AGRGRPRRPPSACPVLVGERITPVGRRGDGPGQEHPAAAASRWRGIGTAEAEQVEVAISAQYRRAEHLLLEQRQPETGAEHCCNGLPLLKQQVLGSPIL